MSEDIRWKQRFSNYQKALGQLQKFVDKGGLIKAFEYTYELAWSTLKDFLEFRGQSDLFGSRDAIQKAFQLNLIEDGEGWMDMLKSRNRTSHSYNQETAREISNAVTTVYYALFQKLNKKLANFDSGT